MKRVVTFGELLLRLSPPGDERLFDSPQLGASFGGAEANVAVGLCRLGLRCDYVTRLPANPVGDAALRALQQEGVGAGWVLRGSDRDRMGIYFVELGPDLRTMRVVYDRAGSAFAQLDPETIAWPGILAGADWLHASGITPALGAGPAAALAGAIGHARATGMRVSFDLNYRAALWTRRDPKALIEPLVAGADLLIGNAAAAQAMLGIDARDDGQTLARQLADRYGCRRVAVTERQAAGAKAQDWSALLYDAETKTLMESRRHHMAVIDRVGGGDCFAAALIAALLDAQPVADALEFAVAAGALKLTTPGDFCRASEHDIREFLRACC